MMPEPGMAQLTEALAAAGMSWDRVAGCRCLAGGTYNAVYLVGLGDDTTVVVKIPPDPARPAVRYERGSWGPRRCITSSPASALVSRCPP